MTCLTFLFLSSGIPLQLDRFLPVFLSDHVRSRPLRSHLRLWPLSHQMDPHRPGMSPRTRTRTRTHTRMHAHTHAHTHTHTHTHTLRHKMWFYVRTNNKSPKHHSGILMLFLLWLAGWHFAVSSKVSCCFLHSVLKCRTHLSETSVSHIYCNPSFLSFCWFLVLDILPRLLWWTVLAVVGVPGVG